MIVAVADTHAIIWYLFGDRRLSDLARSLFEETAKEGNQIALSAITFVEIVYLIERQRIPAETLTRLLAILGELDSLLVEIPLDRHLSRALTQIIPSEIPELPDRIIAATALSLNVPVITRDHKIHLSQVDSFW